MAVAQRQVKLCLVGETNVGKTCMVNRFIGGYFMQPSSATIGGAFTSTPIDYQGTTYILAIWDTAGSEKYRSIVPMFYRGAVAAILVYDITNIDSFNEIDNWLRDMKSRESGIQHLVLCGNKSDRDEERAVTTVEGRRKAQEIDAAFFETSALSDHNIRESFRDVVRQIHWNGRVSVPSSPTPPAAVQLNAPTKKQHHKPCCKT